MLDVHTHTKYSFDCESDLVEMAKLACDKGFSYLAFTDHNDKDYLSITNYDIPQIEIEDYFNEATKVKQQFASELFIAVGIECGFSRNAEKIYKRDLARFNFDVILNSVHTVMGDDCYFPEFFIGKDKDLAYNAYLEAVRQSVDAIYDYDVISHFGYVTRKAPYEDKSLSYFEYSERIDDILKAIIRKNKCLEINTRANDGEFNMLPSLDILKRYRELGGDKISFGSDAHEVEEIGKDYQRVCEAIKPLGFSEWTVYQNRQPIKILF